jgi:hypothetical protein
MPETGRFTDATGRTIESLFEILGTRCKGKRTRRIQEQAALASSVLSSIAAHQNHKGEMLLSKTPPTSRKESSNCQSSMKQVNNSVKSSV